MDASALRTLRLTGRCAAWLSAENPGSSPAPRRCRSRCCHVHADRTACLNDVTRRPGADVLGRIAERSSTVELAPVLPRQMQPDGGPRRRLTEAIGRVHFIRYDPLDLLEISSDEKILRVIGSDFRSDRSCHLHCYRALKPIRPAPVTW